MTAAPVGLDPRSQRLLERNRAVLARLDAGETRASIARDFGLSAQAVSVIERYRARFNSGARRSRVVAEVRHLLVKSGNVDLSMPWVWTPIAQYYEFINEVD